MDVADCDAKKKTRKNTLTVVAHALHLESHTQNAKTEKSYFLNTFAIAQLLLGILFDMG